MGSLCNAPITAAYGCAYSFAAFNKSVCTIEISSCIFHQLYGHLLHVLNQVLIACSNKKWLPVYNLKPVVYLELFVGVFYT